MLVIRTVCTTDWKGRPDHRVVLIAKIAVGAHEFEDRVAAVAAMNEDILKWMVVDIASQELLAMNEDDGWHTEPVVSPDIDENWELHRASSLLITKTPDAIEKMWADTGEARWEMQAQDEFSRKFSRKFVENIGDSDICTTVYHLLTDDLESVLD